MSPTLRRQKLEAALEALKCAESNLQAAQDFADRYIGDPRARPDVDSCAELAVVLTCNAHALARWALTLLADGVAAKALP